MLCEKNRCSGCTACMAACPSGAIQMRQDAEGFLYPHICENKCTHCGRCESVCSAVQRQADMEPSQQQVFACYARDEQIRRTSTSGGAFPIIARNILSDGGCVFGAACGDNMLIEHIKITDPRELVKIQGSKYVQSNLGNTLSQVKKELQTGKPVLFSGTPCQVNGLLSYLNRPFSNLLTCDVVCHGVPSPLVWHDYVAWQELHHQGKCTAVNFRSKRSGWHFYSMEMKFHNGKTYHKTKACDPFARGFLRNLFLRPSCYHCVFANTQRRSDITFADYWGFDELEGEIKHDEKGISQVILNTTKGIKRFDRVRDRMAYEARSMEDARSKNACLREPSAVPPNRSTFWADYQQLDFETIVRRYLYPDKDAAMQKIQWSAIGKRIFFLKKRIKRILRHKGIIKSSVV